jgi:hypothetical protein
LVDAFNRTESHAEVQLKRCPQRLHLYLPSESKYGRAVAHLGHRFIARPA